MTGPYVAAVHDHLVYRLVVGVQRRGAANRFDVRVDCRHDFVFSPWPGRTVPVVGDKVVCRICTYPTAEK